MQTIIPINNIMQEKVLDLPLYSDGLTVVLNQLAQQQYVFHVEAIAQTLEKVIYDFLVFEFGSENFDCEVHLLYEDPAQAYERDTEISGHCVVTPDNTVDICVMLCTYTDKVWIYFDQEKWDDFVFEIGQVVDHEVIHARQYQQRQYKEPIFPKTLQGVERYFGSPDEIQAYAYNVARTLLAQTNNNTQQALNLIHSNQTPMICPILQHYKMLFKQHRYTVWTRFLKRVCSMVQWMGDEKV